jgi:tRNA-Thr(GGU) m(6)t(6)A37 methyltransferase TsaA
LAVILDAFADTERRPSKSPARTGVLLLTWLDRARRDILSVHPRGDTTRQEEGVFSTRSPHRPNPIGLHRVEISSIDGLRVRVRALEAMDGTPILDVTLLEEDITLRLSECRSPRP